MSGPPSLGRYPATRALGKRLDGEAVVASLGHTKYDLFAAADRSRNFYVWGSMGLASSIGLGLALARPDLRVIVLEGDGSLLMNLGSLATIAERAPANLGLIVWDNQQHATTGGQPTATAGVTDLAEIARGAGLRRVESVGTLAEFEASLDRSLEGPGPWVLVARVEESGPSRKPPLDPVHIKNRFMEAIGADAPVD